MGAKDEILIERLMKENEEFSKAKHTHGELAKQLEEYEKKPYLTPPGEKIRMRSL